jgi:glycosyltransferase involved in cell wall biosynthesis
MIKVLLINQNEIPHYRVPVYSHLSRYLEGRGFSLMVVSGGIQGGNPHAVQFDYRQFPLSCLSIAKLIFKISPDVVIFWVNLKNLYLFPVLIFTKVMGKKAIYWGHGRDLLDERARAKNIAYAIEQWICDAIILYAEHLQKHVLTRFHKKVFVANNTLNLTAHHAGSFSKDQTLAKYHIKTKKNIICIGRMQKRKKVHHLFRAFELINNGEIGLVLVGPDTDRILRQIEGDNVHKLGPIYAEDAKLALLSAADVFCLPGALGLSIVDALYCGLPVVTEEGENSAEIMYLRDGINGYIVPKNDVKQMAAKLRLLLEDDTLRAELSRAAKNEIMLKGHIDVMCEGFNKALRFALRKDEVHRMKSGSESVSGRQKREG